MTGTGETTSEGKGLSRENPLGTRPSRTTVHTRVRTPAHTHTHTHIHPHPHSWTQ